MFIVNVTSNKILSNYSEEENLNLDVGSWPENTVLVKANGT